MTAMMSTPRKSPQTHCSIGVCLLCLIAGSCLVAAGIAVAVEFSHAQIHLHKQGGAVAGSIRWVIAGVPVFYRSLDGLAKVDRGDYQVRDSGNGGFNRPVKTIPRIVFLDQAGDQLGWTERTAMINEAEPLQRFLQQDSESEIESTSAANEASVYHFVEPATGTTWDRIQAGLLATAFVSMLAAAGLLCMVAGVLSLYRKAVSIVV